MIVSLLAQGRTGASDAQRGAVSVPFIGCRSDGQVGPVEAPKGTSTYVPISSEAAQELAYYRAAQGFGALAPRGWYCFGLYGSAGATLFVSPQPIDTANVFSTEIGFTGPAIVISGHSGDTSGRVTVAEVIARVFPAYKAFATAVMKEFDPPINSIVFGPYPTDTLTYKSKTAVEFKTPPLKEGLGTYKWIKKSGSPIDGVAILVGQAPDLLLLSVRLPPNLDGLTSAIVRQAERETEHGTRN